MVRVTTITSIERLVGGESIDMGELKGPEGHALLAEIDRKLADLDGASKLREPPMEAFEEFRGNRVWHHRRPKDPACADVARAHVHILHGGGKLDLDLNQLAEISWTGEIANMKPAPGIMSVVTHEPGVLFRTPEAQFGLTPAEANRLANYALEPQEFFAVCDAVGCLWLTHDDFYDPHTGFAYQPMRPSE